MTESSPSRRMVADLLSAERRSLGGSASTVDVCQGVLEQLRRMLEPLIGRAGYEMLLARAVVRGAGRHDVLAGLYVTSEKPVTEEMVADALGRSKDPDEAAVTVLGELLEFMSQLVGWRLTLRVLRDEWPDLTGAYDAAVLEESTHMRREP